ncbi:hypothetical protein [Meridianimarinicoccus aquatilis]|uniref:Uncharacterized protein n=1 Tax=Meridianimarinicoccus aquatilis TaxID=2552766 RepID=A0A4R6ATR6_9RHOB|nr:hypothetical protein [Fluviibacterium aquatile]TDL86924.1 hypothetical protein E2L05_12560 [Fluviibacterium aquatile]
MSAAAGQAATFDLLQEDWQAIASASAVRVIDGSEDVSNDAGSEVASAAAKRLTIEAGASVDTSTATLKTRAGHTNDGRTANAFAVGTAVINEAFQFSESGNIDFTYAIDGILSVRSSADWANATGALNIWDVTGLDSVIKPIGERSFEGDVYETSLFTEAEEVASFFRGIEARGSTASSPGMIGFLPEVDVIDNAQGTSQSVEFSINGSFYAEAGHTYLLRLAQGAEIRNTGVFSGAEADFFNTGVFSFGDLGSTSYITSTGSFFG